MTDINGTTNIYVTAAFYVTALLLFVYGILTLNVKRLRDLGRSIWYSGVLVYNGQLLLALTLKRCISSFQIIRPIELIKSANSHLK